MKKTILGMAIASALGLNAGAALAQSYGDVARVVSSTPVFDTVTTPRRECRIEQVTAYEERRSVERVAEPRSGIGAGTVLGAIVGGVIGHQFGNSSAGRDHGTAAGAVVGGLVGNQIDRDAGGGYQSASREVAVDRVPVTREVERCANVAERTERIVGYDVRYEYHGHEFATRLPYDPGTQMPVNIEVRAPVARGTLAQPRTPNYRGTF